MLKKFGGQVTHATTARVSPTFVNVCAPYWFIVIKLGRFHDSHLCLLHLRVNTLGKGINNGPHIICALIKLRSCRLKLSSSPVHRSLFKVFHTIFKNFLLLDQFCHVSKRIFASVFFKYLQPQPEVFILILQHKYVSIEVIDMLSLFLNVLPQTEIALQHFFHHVNSVDDALSDCIFGFVDSAWQGTSTRASGYVLESLAFFSEELFNVVLVLDDSFGDDESPLC